jgi:hypothetical protein
MKLFFDDSVSNDDMNGMMEEETGYNWTACGVGDVIWLESGLNGHKLNNLVVVSVSADSILLGTASELDENRAMLRE